MPTHLTPESIKNILIIKLRYMGDVLLATPVIREIRKRLPKAKISVLVNIETEGVLKNNSDIDEVIVFDRDSMKAGGWISNAFQQSSFAWKLRKRRFDLVFDLSWGDRSAIFSLLSGARCRVGFDLGTKIRKMAYNVPIDHRMDLHMVDYHCKALKPFGWDAGSPELVFNVVEEDTLSLRKLLELENFSMEHRFVVIHPGARWEFKSWPLGRYAHLGNFIQNELGLKVVWVGGPGDIEKVQRVKTKMQSKSLSLAGKLSISQLGALMKGADLFIGNDSGPMHIASAVRTPVLAFFGPTDPKMWGPRGKNHLIFYHADCCGPIPEKGCTRETRWCMDLIGLEEVIETLKVKFKNYSIGSVASQKYPE